MQTEIVEGNPQILNQNKLFICTSDPSKSFSLDLSSEEMSSLTIQQFIEKANQYFKSQNKFLELSDIQNKIQSLHYMKQDYLLKYSHLNIMPIFFNARQYLFEIKVLFNGEILQFELPIFSYQDNLLEKVSEQLAIPKNKLYLLNNSDVLTKSLQSYDQVELFVANDQIFYDEQEIYVDFKLSIEKNCNIFKFGKQNDIYKENKLISKQETFLSANINNGDKLTSYYMRDVLIKDIKTVIKSTFKQNDAKELYLKYFPDEKGRISVEQIEDTLHIVLKNGWELMLHIKTLTGDQIEIFANENETVEQLKQRIFDITDIDPESQRLMYAGRQLSEEQLLSNYKIQDQSTIHLILKLGNNQKNKPLNISSLFNKRQKKENNEESNKEGGENIKIQVKTLTGKSLSINCNPNDTIYQVKQQIQDKEGVPEDQQRLICCGQSLENERKLSEYPINSSSVIHLVLTLSKQKKVQTAERLKKSDFVDKLIKINIKTLTGKEMEIKAKLSETVEILKFKIQDSEGIPPDQQRLIFIGKQLEDDFMLQEYGICDGDILNLVLRLRGGGTVEKQKLFVDLENEKSKKQRNFSMYAPDYRIASEGLNIEGKCTKRSCRYFGKQVICPIGYDAVEIIHDEYNQVVCPGCNSSIEIITCGFVSCQYSWCGIKVTEGKERFIESKMLESESNKYTTYDPVKQDGSSNMVYWKQLFIYAKQQSYRKYPQCCICLKKIYYEEDITNSEVCLDKENHKCHIQCLEKLALLEKKCILCLPNY